MQHTDPTPPPLRAKQRPRPPRRPQRKPWARKTCDVKWRFDSVHAAMRRVRAIRESYGKQMHAYDCPVCGGWHLSSQPPHIREDAARFV